MISNKKNLKLQQEGYKYNLSDHFFNHDILNFIHYLLIKAFYHVNFINIYSLSLSKFYISDMTMTGITSVTHDLMNPLLPNLNFSTNYYIEGNHFLSFSPQTHFWVSIPLIMVFSVLVFSILLYINYKIYCKKVTKSKNLKKQKHRGLLMQLISLTIFKCIIVGFIFVSIKQKYRPVQNTNKLLNKNYVLSIDHYMDTYNYTKLQTKSLHEWYAMSKIKFKNYKSFFQILILLSGDVA